MYTRKMGPQMKVDTEGESNCAPAKKTMVRVLKDWPQTTNKAPQMKAPCTNLYNKGANKSVPPKTFQKGKTKGTNESDNTQKGRLDRDKGKGKGKWFIEHRFTEMERGKGMSDWKPEGKGKKVKAGKDQKGKSEIISIHDDDEPEEPNQPIFHPDEEKENQLRAGWMKAMYEEGQKLPDFQNPKKIRKIMRKLQDSFDYPPCDPAKNW